MPTATKRDWPSLLKLIPGYDCFRGAAEAGFHFDEAKANRVCDFFETQLCIIEGKAANQPFVLLDWERAFLGCVFGWLDKGGLRRYREALLYVPRKNGKSPLVGGIMDYVLLCDGEPGAQCYCAAADVSQASIVYRHASGMIERNPGLMRYCQVFRTTKCIQAGQNFARVLSADAPSKHGYNSHLVLIDELHAQPNRELVDVLTTSTSSRTQPLIIYVTTADYDRPSICNEKYDYASKVRDGLIEDYRFLPMVYELTSEEDWEKEENWAKANPSLGVIKTWDYMRRECQKAKEQPSYQAAFRRLELNQRTSTRECWLQLSDWDKGAGHSIDEAELMATPCWGGLDLASTKDVAALALAWKLPPDAYLVKTWYWIPEATAQQHEKEDRVPYLAWADQGFVELTPGNTIDYAYIRAKINEVAGTYKLQDIGSDPWNATEITTNLMAQDGIQMVTFRQGYASLSAPSKEFERAVVAGKLFHGGNPVLRWMASNCVVVQDPAGNIKPDKARSSQKIDGIVAVIMAIGRAMAPGEPVESDVYNERGVRWV